VNRLDARAFGGHFQKTGRAPLMQASIAIGPECPARVSRATGRIAVKRTGRRFGLEALLPAFALALGACAGHLPGGNRDPDLTNPLPQSYKSDILAMLHVYLRDPTQIREAAASEPKLQPVGRANRYVVCLRFNAKKSNGEYAGLKQYAVIFVAGRLDQMVEAKPEECAKAEYQPFPEAETLTR
jgi:hypothetical protein